MNKKIFNEMVLLNEQTWERLYSIMQSEDDIGVVLRLHLVTEKIIEAWCCAASSRVILKGSVFRSRACEAHLLRI
ncbi:hypothetical protein J9P32_001462 [Salmonella enterica]|nr:hypothetical protein [Salmonella enterica]